MNELVYIGQTKNLLKRKRQHISELRHNNHYNAHLQRSWNKYGEDAFVWNVIEHCGLDELDEAETYWIDKYDSHAYGYNQTDGGSSLRGYKWSSESRIKHVECMKRHWTPERRDEQRQRMIGDKNPMYGRIGDKNPAYGKDHSRSLNGMYGKHHSESSIEKNRKAHTGKNNVNSIPVICEETNEIFASMGEAGREKRCDDATICKVCKGVKKTAGGYHWRYATQEEIEMCHEKNTRDRVC